MAFGFYKAVTIQTGQVPSSQLGFPALVPFLAGDADYATVANGGKAQNANGYDIRPYSDSGLTTALPFELVWYDAATGAFEMWVKTTAVDSAVVYMAVGDAGVTTDGSNAASAFSQFQAVAHFGNGSVGVIESISGGSGRTGVTSAASGPFGGGAVDVATSGYVAWDGVAGATVDITHPGSTDHSFSFWHKRTTANNSDGAIGQFFLNLSGVLRFGVLHPYLDSTLYWDDGGFLNGRLSTPYGAFLDSWAYIVVDGKGDDSAGHIYINGVLKSSRSVGETPTATQDGWITPYAPGTPYSIDEYRYARNLKSADWITTEYNNQSDLSTFWSKGSLTPVGGGGSVIVPVFLLMAQQGWGQP